MRIRGFRAEADLAWLYSFLKNETAGGVRQWAGSTLRHPITPEQLAAHAKRLNVKIPLRRAYIAVDCDSSDRPTAYAELYNIKRRASAFITRMIVRPDYRGRRGRAGIAAPHPGGGLRKFSAASH